MISYGENKGYVASLGLGSAMLRGDIVVVMDADGQHDPDDVPRLVKPIIDGEADIKTFPIEDQYACYPSC